MEITEISSYNIKSIVSSAAPVILNDKLPRKITNTNLKPNILNLPVYYCI